MKKAKCTNCGANIEVDESKEAGICKYCGSAYITENAIKNYNTTITNTSNNNANTIVNNYYNAPFKAQANEVRYIPPRPTINIFIATILCCLYLFPGLIYISVIKNKQREWDED